MRASASATTDESVVERGQARRRQCPQRRELVAKVGREELEQMRCGGDVFQAMPSERLDTSRRGTGSSPAISRVARETNDLIAVGGSADPGRDDDVHPDVALVAERRLARVDADPQPKRLVGRPRLGGEPRCISTTAARASRARGKARKAPSPAQSTSTPPYAAADCRTISRMRARAGAKRSPRRWSSRVEPSTSAKTRVTVPVGRSLRDVVGSSTRTSLGASPGNVHAAGRSGGLGVHFRAVFDTLSDKLQATLGGLGRGGRLDEEAISKAMREIRLALLEADVNLEVARDFTRDRQGACARTGRPEEPHAGPAGREDRPRGADRAHGLGRLAARVRPRRRR